MVECEIYSPIYFSLSSSSSSLLLLLLRHRPLHVTKLSRLQAANSFSRAWSLIPPCCSPYPPLPHAVKPVRPPLKGLAMMEHAREDAGPQKKELELNGGGKVSLASTTDKYDPETLEIDHVAEKKLVRKLDRYIVPMVMLLYLLVSLMLSLLLIATPSICPMPYANNPPNPPATAALTNK